MTVPSSFLQWYFHASCKAKLKFIDPPTISLCSYETAWKKGFLRCRRPGLSISISRHKVVLRQVHALHEKRSISLRGASYAMDLGNESVGRKPGGATREMQPMKRNPRNEPMKCNRWDTFVRLRISAFRASMWAARPSNSAIFLYNDSQIAR